MIYIKCMVVIIVLVWGFDVLFVVIQDFQEFDFISYWDDSI